MLMLTRCSRYESGELPGRITMSRDSSASYNIWHITCQMSAHIQPLAGCVRPNHPFEWTPLLDKCLQSIKALACKVPILRPVDPKNPDPIWVITDDSKSGISAVYGQGPEWQTCRPAGFLSKKFSVAQQHYRTHMHETIAVLQALMKWEDKLLGRKLLGVLDTCVVTRAG
jgi:RNase H-like domain found in reverse transcriptase